MKRFLLATLTFILLVQPLANATTIATPPAADPTFILSEAQAGLADWDITLYAEHPAELRSTTAQHFIDESFARFQDLSPALTASEFHDVRTALRAQDPTDDAGLIEKMKTFSEHLTNTKSGERLGAWSIGIAAGELEDNALNDKNHDRADHELRTIIPLITLDTLFPAMHDLRWSLLTIRQINPKSDDWQRLAITAHAMRQIIAAAPTKDQTTITGLFSIHPNSSAAHRIDKDTAQIEFINTDGSLKTMTSYADRKSRTSDGNIHCGIDKIAYQQGSFFLPLTIPAIGKDISESSFQSIVSGCEKIEGLQPALNYHPGIITPLSTMLGLLEMTDPVDGKIVLDNFEHADRIKITSQDILPKH